MDMATAAKSVAVVRSKQKELLYTIDVLTDGSEGTGDGTLFLSVWKNTNFDSSVSNGSIIDAGDDAWYTAAPAARYCLSGALHADATSRLAADQRFKLGTSVRAIFCAPSQQQQQQGYGWSGLTPLHLALRKAGAAQVSVVIAPAPAPAPTTSPSPNGNRDAAATVEKVIELTEGTGGRNNGRLFPLVNICQLPQNDNDNDSSSSSSSSASTWWKVYQDEYLLVHARRLTGKGLSLSSSSSRAAAVLFLYTLMDHHPNQRPNSSNTNDSKKAASAFVSFSSFLVSSPHDCSIHGLEKIMTAATDKNSNNNNSLQLPVISLSELVQENGKKKCNYLVDKKEIPIHCRFAIALRPPDEKPENSRGMNKPTRTDNDDDTHSGNRSSSSSSSSSDDSSDESSSSSDASISDEDSSTSTPSENVYWTQPSSHQTDPSLLVRAQQQSLQWNAAAPEYFPWNERDHQSSGCTGPSPHDRRLRTGTSLAFTARQQGDEKPFIVDRMSSIRNKSGSGSSGRSLYSSDEDNAVEGASSSNTADSSNFSCEGKLPHQFLDFLQTSTGLCSSISTIPTAPVDENEIDLDDDDDDEDADNDDNDMKGSGIDDDDECTRGTRHVKLLVLGTGCASPSAHRGASGYALLFPNTEQTVAATVTAASPPSKDYSYIRGNDNNHPEWAMAIEAGEGFVTQWHRYSPMSIGKIRLIWISHAHWDHYGGLAPLLVAIRRAKETERVRLGVLQPEAHNSVDKDDKTKPVEMEHRQKRARRDTATIPSSTSSFFDDASESDPPWVMAPRKVLKFLELVLPTVVSKNGRCHRYYRGVPLDDNPVNNSHHRRAPTTPTTRAPNSMTYLASDAFEDLNRRFDRTIAFWENIQVDHCRNAFGFVAGLRRAGTGDEDPFVFAFSGDTRPCQRFARVCRDRAESRCHTCGDCCRLDNHSRLHFLLHEATFDQEEQQMAISKKHSTIPEALQVARDVQAERVLLTHFSQRYNNDSLFSGRHSTNDTDKDESSSSPSLSEPLVGVALDGMLVPLYDYRMHVQT